MAHPNLSTPKGTTRRDFIRNSSLLVAGGAMAAGSLNIARAAHSFGSDEIKIGLVGCGGRGSEAANQAMNTSGGPVKLVAMADAFEDRLQASYRSIKSAKGEKVEVPKERMFSGFDGYKDLLKCDLDLVILATPPGFRPLHFEAAIAAGKHVFMEKPVATDPAGVRRVLNSVKIAKEKSLAVQVGLQRHHERKYMATVKAIQDGAIGDIILARAYWNGQTPWVRPRQENFTELEYQMRNWYYFNWLCGDHIVEQHIHNLDVINWIKNAYPKTAQGVGGCEVRKGKEYGETFDHHMVEFTYPDGTVLLSECRHQPNCWNSVSEYVHGTKGRSDVSGSKIYDAGGSTLQNFDKLGADGWQQEHHDLFADLRAGRIPNEGEYGALSTMTAIFGRMATYSGQKIDWEKCLNYAVPLANFDALKSMQDEAPVKPGPDGFYKLPVPGQGDWWQELKA
jgi:myo-inositol 2-dehydrogenase / D-chiro-inositol 1-dehydrogenase